VSALQFHIRRIAMARRALKELAAIAERRAAAAQRPRKLWRVQVLSDDEAEAIVGTDLLAQVAMTMRHA